jgi:hypothetical protein
MKVSDPLWRGLRTALQLAITLLSTGALVTVLNGLLHAREEYSAFSAVLLLLVTTALNSLDARGGGCPAECRESARRSYRWPLDPGTEGWTMSTLAEIDAELARLVEILAEPIAWHSRRAREAENEQVRNRIDELLEERLALIERCN